jgi:pyridoxal phosphate enzyme (YggS family)
VTQITDHLAKTLDRIAIALASAGRPADAAMLLAVSKQQPTAAVEAAYRAGQRRFGESVVQEALAKMEQLAQLDIEWHFIGRIQSNKTRAIAERFQWVHTVDRARIAARLNEQRPHFAPPLKVLIQVDLAGEPQKGGVDAAALPALAEFVAAQPRLELKGLMTIPPADEPVGLRRARFERLAELHRELCAEGLALDTLSMGMSADYELAIAAGSTCVRIGTGVFGPRADHRG